MVQSVGFSKLPPSPPPPPPVGEGWSQAPVPKIMRMLGDSYTRWIHRDGFSVLCSVEMVSVAPGWPHQPFLRISISCDTGKRSMNRIEIRRAPTDEEVERVTKAFGEGWEEDSLKAFVVTPITRQFLRRLEASH